MRPTRRAGRAGFTLVEMVVVSTFVAIFAVFLAGTIVTSTTMNRDTYVENEVVDLANRTADEVAAALSGAGRFTDAYDLSTLGDQLEFQDTRFNDVSALREFGVNLPGQTSGVPNFGLDGVKRLVFVAERTFNETNYASNVDINGDGDRLDTAVVTGRLELRTFVFSSGALVEQAGLRRTFGGGSARFCQRPLDQPIFGRTPHTSWTAGTPPTLTVWYPRAGQIVRTEDDTSLVAYPGANHDPLVIPGETAFGQAWSPTFYAAPATGVNGAKLGASPGAPPNDFTDPSTPITTQPDTAVRINLRVLYNPTPDARGRAEIHALSLARTVSLQ